MIKANNIEAIAQAVDLWSSFDLYRLKRDKRSGNRLVDDLYKSGEGLSFFLRSKDKRSASMLAKRIGLYRALANIPFGKAASDQAIGLEEDFKKIGVDPAPPLEIMPEHAGRKHLTPRQQKAPHA